MVTKFELSTWSIIKTLFVLVGFWLVWQIREILVLLFLVIVLVSALRPIVHWFVQQGVPRVAAVTILTLLIIGGFLLILSLIVPAVIDQLQELILVRFPGLINQLSPYYASLTQGKTLLNDLASQLQHVSGNLLSGVISFFGGLVSAITIVVITFYLLLEENPIRKAGLELIPIKYREQFADSFERIAGKMGAWLRGQFLLSVVIAITTTIGMAIIGVPAPLAIGLTAGLLEILPIVGPLLAGLVMVIMAATSTDAVLLKISLSVIFAVAQQFLENHFLVPNVMKQAIGLSPVVVIVALLIGAKLDGITGAIIAVPLAAVIQVAAQDWPKFKAVRRTQEAHA